MSKLSEERLIQALEHHFARHRIVIWYDTEGKLREFYDQVTLPDIEKIIIQNNEFAVKYRVLNQEPGKRFLLFREGPRPDDINNWLLDVELAYTEFKADQASIWRSDLGLGPEFTGLVTTHSIFFESRERRDKLKEHLEKGDNEHSLKLKMVAICTGTKPDLYMGLESLLNDNSEDKDTSIKLIQRCGLDKYLWNELKRRFHYSAANPTIKDFGIQLFETAYGYAINDESRKKLSQETLIFIQRWQANLSYHESFARFSTISNELLKIQSDFSRLPFEQVLNVDCFKSVEAFIANQVIKSVIDRTLTLRECQDIISRRRGNYWYKDYENRYQAAHECCGFFQSLNKVTLQIDSFQQGIQSYASTWFNLDRYYRNALFFLKKAGDDEPIKKLMDDIEKAYLNKYLLKLNDSWQGALKSIDYNKISTFPQSYFYPKKILPFVNNQKKVAVIISDALRYEAGVELMEAIRREDKYDAQIDPMVSMLPSYTQLGMAALLPNKKLGIDKNGNVTIDGKPTSGLHNRNAILAEASDNQAIAKKSEDLIAMGTNAIKDIKRDYNVLYVYHNRIDSIGDKRETENQVIEAVSQAIEDILALIKKLASADFYNMFITSDHGFIYQNQPVEESDYIEFDDKVSKETYRDRRFIIGTKLADHPGMLKKTASELGLAGDVEISFPKSISRLRLRGSGSRYVHGGTSMQELVIPLITVNKKRKSDITYVDVDILQKGTSRITTGQVPVFFYQLEPVSEKVHSRRLIAGVYTKDDKLLSQEELMIFDRTTEEGQDREFRVTFRLISDTSAMDNQEVFVKLKEQVEDTSYYIDYKKRSMILQSRFERDFDV